jgi:Pathogenicity locus
MSAAVGGRRAVRAARPKVMTKLSDHRVVTSLEQIPNVGPSIAEDLRQIGVRTPRALVGRDPYRLYMSLCKATHERQDPCVLDVFISAVKFMEGRPVQPWWRYTAERKQMVAARAGLAAGGA